MSADHSVGNAAPRPANPQPERRARTDQRREQLLDAAEVVIRRVGTRVSANQIAREAGVTKPIIYRHFGDMQDLYHAFAVRQEERLVRWLFRAREQEEGRDRRTRFRAVVDAFFYAIEREPNIYRFLVLTGGDHQGGAGTLSWFTQIWAGAIGRHLAAITGQPEDATEPRVMAIAMAGALIATGNWWLAEQTAPQADVVDAVTTFLLAGLPEPTHEAGAPPAQLGRFLDH